ncbi:MAG TPA: SGNH/GDSL hydrolase family protein, partial [Variovorax sp.]|nr:SGNH/GDSL hydrolase family protein [Variovorax sp.]
AIRQLSIGNPLVSFFDDAAWLTRQVGGRTEAGKPDYKTISIGPNLRVTNTMGDDPHNTVLADDHNGVVLNTLWAQSLVQHLIDAFDLPLTPINDEEVVRFLEPLFDSARAPGS